MPEVADQVQERNDLAEGVLAQRVARPGEVISGTVVALDREGAWVDIGSKSEGIIPPYEMQTMSPGHPLKVGDVVSVFVLRVGEGGRLVLSLDRARRRQGWQRLEEYLASGQPLEAEVTAVNRGGLIVRYEGIEGFVPLSQVAGLRSGEDQEGENALAQRVGQTIKFKVLELNRPRRRLIFSERLALREERERLRERLLAELKEGEVRRGRVKGIHSFGAFVDLGGIEGLVPASELSWEMGKSPQEIVSLGDEVEVMVLRIDQETKKIALSLRRTQPHPWELVQEKYQQGQRTTGTVTRLATFGAFVRLDGSIEGLIHISELSSRRINHPKEVVQEGEVLELKVLSIDPERRRLRLSLRQAQEEF